MFVQFCEQPKVDAPLPHHFRVRSASLGVNSSTLEIVSILNNIPFQIFDFILFEVELHTKMAPNIFFFFLFSLFFLRKR